MKKKKIVALLTACMLMTGMFTGCGSSQQAAGSSGAEAGQTQTGDNSLFNEPGQLPIVNEPVTLTVFAPANPDGSWEDNEMVKELEETTGIHLEWQTCAASDNVQEKLSTMFASGDLPDIILTGVGSSNRYDKATEQALGEQGLILPLNDYLDTVSVGYKQALDEIEGMRDYITTPNGNIYSLPNVDGSLHVQYNMKLWINTQWLDNLGLEMPTTTEEFYQVMKAFKEQDANGNGNPDDEVPLDFNAYGGNNAWFNSAYSLTNLLGATGIQLTNWGQEGYFAEDGKVKCYAVDERYRDFLRFMSELYKEGLINQKALTSDYSTYQSLSRGDEDGNALVGVAFGWEETDKFGPKLYTQYVPLAPLAYDVDCEPGTYDTRWRNDYSGLNMSANRICMSAKCKNPEAAMRFIDTFYDEAASVQVLFGGITDGCVEQTGDHSFKVLPPLDADMDPGTWKWTNAFAGNGPMYIRRSTELEMAQDMTFAVEERKDYDAVLNKMGESDYYPQMFMKYTDEDQNTMALTQANINNIIDNYWSLWLTGESDIDKDWDTYVQNVNDAGLPQILEIRQAAFEEYLNK